MLFDVDLWEVLRSSDTLVVTETTELPHIFISGPRWGDTCWRGHVTSSSPMARLATNLRVSAIAPTAGYPTMAGLAFGTSNMRYFMGCDLSKRRSTVTSVLAIGIRDERWTNDEEREKD